MENSSNMDVSLTGWTVSSDATKEVFDFPEDFMLASGMYVFIFIYAHEILYVSILVWILCIYSFMYLHTYIPLYNINLHKFVYEDYEIADVPICVNNDTCYVYVRYQCVYMVWRGEPSKGRPRIQPALLGFQVMLPYMHTYI